MIFLLSLLTFLYKSRMVCEKIRRRTMESCDETHNSIANDYEERAENVDVTTTHPHSSCYEGLMEQTELLRRARKHQDESRKIRKIFLDIDKEGKSIPADDEMLRKGVLTVSGGKTLFSIDQLIQVCIHMFEGLPFVAFKGPADARQMPVLMWWSFSQLTVNTVMSVK